MGRHRSDKLCSAIAIRKREGLQRETGGASRRRIARAAANETSGQKDGTDGQADAGRFCFCREMKTTPASRLLTATLAALFVAALPSHGATIIWDTATTISGDSDVSTTGTLERAYNFDRPADNLSPVVNGVTFSAFNVANGAAGPVTVGSTTVSSTTGFFASGTLGSVSSPFSALSAGYQNLLKTAAFEQTAASSWTLTLNGLTNGSEYLFQGWVNASSVASGLSTASTTVTSGNAVTLDANVGNVEGGVGQFVTGTFTADATSQVITFSGSTGNPVNAFQLRAIPEPSSIALFVMAGGVGLLFASRRRMQMRA
jgi:hypothetical protein